MSTYQSFNDLNLPTRCFANSFVCDNIPTHTVTVTSSCSCDIPEVTGAVTNTTNNTQIINPNGLKYYTSSCVGGVSSAALIFLKFGVTHPYAVVSGGLFLSLGSSFCFVILQSVGPALTVAA